jgi:hypothetical protein
MMICGQQVPSTDEHPGHQAKNFEKKYFLGYDLSFRVTRVNRRLGLAILNFPLRCGSIYAGIHREREREREREACSEGSKGRWILIHGMRPVVVRSECCGLDWSGSG